MVMGVGAVLVGVATVVTVGAVGDARFHKGESLSKGVVVPRAVSLVCASCCVDQFGFLQ